MRRLVQWVRRMWNNFIEDGAASYHRRHLGPRWKEKIERKDE